MKFTNNELLYILALGGIGYFFLDLTFDAFFAYFGILFVARTGAHLIVEGCKWLKSHRWHIS